MTRAGDLLHEAGVVGAGKAAYGFAFLLFMLPHSLITVSLVTALFTRMSQAAHAGRDRDVVDDLNRGLRMPAVVLIPGTVAAVLLGSAAVRVAFPGNSPEQANAIAAVVIAMMLGALPFGWLYLVQRVYYAFEDAKTPFYLQLVVTVVATAANLVAATVDPERTGIVVGLGQTLSNLAAAVVGLALLRRRFGSLRLRQTTRLYVRLGIAALVAGAAAFVLAVDAGPRAAARRRRAPHLDVVARAAPHRAGGAVRRVPAAGPRDAGGRGGPAARPGAAPGPSAPRSGPWRHRLG